MKQIYLPCLCFFAGCNLLFYIFTNTTAYASFPQQLFTYSNFRVFYWTSIAWFILLAISTQSGLLFPISLIFVYYLFQDFSRQVIWQFTPSDVLHWNNFLYLIVSSNLLSLIKFILLFNWRKKVKFGKMKKYPNSQPIPTIQNESQLSTIQFAPPTFSFTEDKNSSLTLQSSFFENLDSSSPFKDCNSSPKLAAPSLQENDYFSSSTLDSKKETETTDWMQLDTVWTNSQNLEDDFTLKVKLDGISKRKKEEFIEEDVMMQDAPALQEDSSQSMTTFTHSQYKKWILFVISAIVLFLFVYYYCIIPLIEIYQFEQSKELTMIFLEHVKT